MKSIKIFHLFLFVSLIMASCFEDQGNYDYADEKKNSIYILYKSYTATPYQGEPVVFEPTLRFDDLQQTDTNVYRWSYHFDGMGCVCKERNMKMVIPTAILGKKYNGIVVAKDTTTGMMYTQNISFQYKSRYATGWLLLTDHEGKSKLDIVREQNGAWFTDENIYHGLHQEELGTQPTRLVLNLSTTREEIRIMQQGQEGSLILDNVSYIKLGSMAKEFVDGKLPDGFVPKFMCSTRVLALLQGENGRVYTKIFQNKNAYLFESFVNIPLAFGNQVLDVEYVLTTYPESSHTGVFVNPLLYDKSERRFLVLKGDSYTNAGKLSVVKIPAKWDNETDPMPNNLAGYENLYSCLKNISSNSGDCLSILRHEKTGKCFVYVFTYDTSKDKLSKIDFEELSSPLIDEETKFHALRKRPYLFFTAGANSSQLYGYDLNTKKQWLCQDFGSHRITSIESNYTDDESVAIGLDNGEFYLLDVSEAALVSGVTKIIYNTKVSGKIVDMIYKLK